MLVQSVAVVVEKGAATPGFQDFVVVPDYVRNGMRINIRSHEQVSSGKLVSSRINFMKHSFTEMVTKLQMLFFAYSMLVSRMVTVCEGNSIT